MFPDIPIRFLKRQSSCTVISPDFWEGCGLAPVIDRLRPIGYGRKAVLCLQENGKAVHVILVDRYADDVERFFDCDCINLVGGVVIVSLMWLPKDTIQHGSVAKLLLLKGRLLRE